MRTQWRGSVLAGLGAGGHILGPGQELHGDVQPVAQDTVMPHGHALVAQALADGTARYAEEFSNRFKGDAVFQHPDLELEEALLLPACGG